MFSQKTQNTLEQLWEKEGRDLSVNDMTTKEITESIEYMEKYTGEFTKNPRSNQDGEFISNLFDAYREIKAKTNEKSVEIDNRLEHYRKWENKPFKINCTSCGQETTPQYLRENNPKNIVLTPCSKCGSVTKTVISINDRKNLNTEKDVRKYKLLRLSLIPLVLSISVASFYSMLSLTIFSIGVLALLVVTTVLVSWEVSHTGEWVRPAYTFKMDYKQ